MGQLPYYVPGAIVALEGSPTAGSFLVSEDLMTFIIGDPFLFQSTQPRRGP